MILDQLLELEPRLSTLLDFASMIGRSGRVDEAQAWATLKPALDGLVGWFRQDPGDPELFAPEAYQAAAQALLKKISGSIESCPSHRRCSSSKRLTCPG